MRSKGYHAPADQPAVADQPRPVRQRLNAGAGDGPACPEEGCASGKLYHTGLGHLWCAQTQTLFALKDGHDVGAVIRTGDHVVLGTIMEDRQTPRALLLHDRHAEPDGALRDARG